jgi:hypothetical protein
MAGWRRWLRGVVVVVIGGGAAGRYIKHHRIVGRTTIVLILIHAALMYKVRAPPPPPQSFITRSLAPITPVIPSSARSDGMLACKCCRPAEKGCVSWGACQNAVRYHRSRAGLPHMLTLSIEIRLETACARARSAHAATRAPTCPPARPPACPPAPRAQDYVSDVFSSRTSCVGVVAPSSPHGLLPKLSRTKAAPTHGVWSRT